jgi:hypothetical protein
MGTSIECGLKRRERTVQAQPIPILAAAIGWHSAHHVCA